MKKHLIQTAVILAAVSAFGLTACAQGSTSAPIPDTLKVENVKDSIFDQIFPGLLPLGVTFLCVWLYNKNVKTIYIILGIFDIFPSNLAESRTSF